MFARQHPVLFFLMMLSTCFTVLVVGFFAILVIGGAFFSKQYAPAYATDRGNIGIVEVNGVILSSKKIIHDLQSFHDNDAIQAIVLRIDSPGGGIGPSQEIYREIRKLKKDKKIVASMGSVAASGGYYIAAATDLIVANPGTLTGSIGVIMEYANLMKIAEKIGISPVVIKSGEFKDMGSPLRELTTSEKKIFQNLVDELHAQFVSDAALGRGINVETMAQLADGRVYTGQSALNLKLIDRLGNMDDAVQLAGTLAGMKGELVPVYPKEDRISFIKRLTETLLQDINFSGRITDNFSFIIN